MKARGAASPEPGATGGRLKSLRPETRKDGSGVGQGLGALSLALRHADHWFGGLVEVRGADLIKALGALRHPVGGQGGL